MQPSIYLINPKEGTLGYYGAEVLGAWGVAAATNLVDLATPTVAALVPPDWAVTLCDERVQAIDFDTTAAVVGITGKVSQRERMVALAAEFRGRGKLVLIGGPAASLEPEAFQPHADILVTGELEDIAPRLFAEIASDTWSPRYEGGRPDLGASPIPRWDLYPRNVALVGQVQTSRGCPFECEFCDVIQYLGRKQRWKEPEQVVAELDVLHRRGFRYVFLADDNFTVMRRRTRELLVRLIDWNAERPDARVQFSTQASIDLARDPELLKLCVRANLRTAFFGIETPNQDSLAETMKRQNLRVDLASEIRKITRAGMMAMCGMIVGFDNDGPDIFERQLAFIQSLPVPMIMFGTLVAPAATPLYARLQGEGRLTAEKHLGGGEILQTNIVPKRMTREQLHDGSRWLVNRIYAPEAFADRLSAFVATYGIGETRPPGPPLGQIEHALLAKLASLGPAERALAELIVAIAGSHPDLTGHLSNVLLGYCQVRYMYAQYGVWNPELARREAPIAA